MNSKLTRAQLHERARENVKALKLASRQTAFESAREEILADLQLAELALSTMDSEPTIANCDPEVYEKGVSVCLVAIPKETAEIICQNITAATGCKVDWHYFGGRVHIKALRVTSQPAPVVPEEMTIRDACKFVQDMRLFDDVSVIVMRTWNACRAAMLQELKKSAGTEAICRSNENVQAVEVQSLTSINPAPDLVSLQKKTESIIGNYPGIPDCWCCTCRPVVLNDMRFVVCPDCGNKRCPRANDHRNACTGSNEPGQEGSAYPAAPQEAINALIPLASRNEQEGK